VVRGAVDGMITRLNDDEHKDLSDKVRKANTGNGGRR
jgi:hypothetical protein